MSFDWGGENFQELTRKEDRQEDLKESEYFLALLQQPVLPQQQSEGLEGIHGDSFLFHGKKKFLKQYLNDANKSNIFLCINDPVFKQK